MIFRSIAKMAFQYLPLSLRVRYLYWRQFRKLCHLSKPRTFNEKIAHFKLRVFDPRIPPFVDKITAKKLVSSLLGDTWVTKSLYEGTAPPTMDVLAGIPVPYVVKAAHGSGWNLFITNSTGSDFPMIIAKCEEWLSQTYNRRVGEWAYSHVPRRVLIEPFIGLPPTLPLDYKFFVFAGRVHFIQVDLDRGTNHRRVMFDRNWQKAPFTYEYPPDDRQIQRPASLETMIAAAEELGSPFPFVRVDLYEIDGVPRFGEMTFTPENGMGIFTPSTYDTVLGQLWP